ncbi:uncharacterized protein F4822DRAFT_379175 [Hypoxylon trugodes]|uniref:uncharacterized protein n=1 Tax=Hypoxylon trugodes TaxID=326681 RepID=UPI002190CCFA|nr:uncharacterized protein F4822DRAFT_379175 [Hypoxylon trugodes]KAI1384975.1 hypothetical protein F4822DRAFT_379175 [Hypoxylon trugodes]
MASITERIRTASERHNELLAILSETDHAQPALQQQTRYVSDLNNELSVVQQRIATLDKQRAKEFKEHKRYRDSVMKRFAYRVGGKAEKFQAKAEKEEREYFDVLQQEHQAKEQENTLRDMRSKAIEVQSDLEAGVTRHTDAQQQLDNLYDSIFQGPTPVFPEEDRLEETAESALQIYHNSRVVMETELQVVQILTEAQNRLRESMNYTEEALDHSRMDMFGVGGSLMDMMERDALQKAEIQVSQTLSLVRQAQRMSPIVRDLPPINVAEGSLISDILFDNIFTDMAFHEKIKDFQLDLQRALDNIRGQLASATSRYQGAEQEMTAHAATLKAAREELQKARERIFERIINDNVAELPTPADDPPPY